MAWPSDPEAMRLVDVVRAIIGLDPLYMNKRRTTNATNSRNYTRLEALSRRAKPDCPRCEGAGYTTTDVYLGEIKCPCVSVADPSTPSESGSRTDLDPGRAAKPCTPLS